MIAHIKEVEGQGLVIDLTLEKISESDQVKRLLSKYGATGLVSAETQDGSQLTLVVPVEISKP
jgi:hypothetical protein